MSMFGKNGVVDEGAGARASEWTADAGLPAFAAGLATMNIPIAETTTSHTRITTIGLKDKRCIATAPHAAAGLRCAGIILSTNRRAVACARRQRAGPENRRDFAWSSTPSARFGSVRRPHCIRSEQNWRVSICSSRLSGQDSFKRREMLPGCWRVFRSTSVAGTTGANVRLEERGMHSVKAEEARGIVSGRLLVRLVVVLVALASVTAAFLVVATPVVSAATPRAVVLPATLPDYMKYIQVNSYKFDPLGKMPSIPDSLSYGVAPPGQTGYYVVQFNGPVTDAMKASLEWTGVVLLYYINYNAFIVRGDGLAIQGASSLPIVRWTGVFQPAYKLSPTLSDSYAAMAEKQMENELTGQTLNGGVVTSFDTAST